MERRIETLAELEAEAARLVDMLMPKRDSATLVALSGELGAGKTAFVKAVAKTLGVEETVTSPTFVLEKIYALPEGKKFTRLAHIDAYRLETGAQLAPLGFDEIMQDGTTLVMLEWPERVAPALPPPAAHLMFAIESDESRTITYE